LGVGDDAIHDGVCERWICEVFMPFGHGEHGGDDGCPLGVSVFQQLEQRQSDWSNGANPKTSMISKWNLLIIPTIGCHRDEGVFCVVDEEAVRLCG
jgi:hypothetical protein